MSHDTPQTDSAAFDTPSKPLDSLAFTVIDTVDGETNEYNVNTPQTTVTATTTVANIHIENAAQSGSETPHLPPSSQNIERMYSHSPAGSINNVAPTISALKGGGHTSNTSQFGSFNNNDNFNDYNNNNNNNNEKIDPLEDESIKNLSLLSKIFLQLFDKPTETDIINNDAFEKHCDKNEIPYDAMASRNEIWGFFIFDWANSPMWQIALALSFPSYLAVLSTRYACLNNVPFECDYNNNPINSDKTLRVSMGIWELKPESYSAAMISISSILQAFAYITIGGLADYKNYQHYLFRICSFIGASFNLFWIFFDTPNTWLIAGWWGSFGVIFFGLALIFYNAYLTPIVQNHWYVCVCVCVCVTSQMSQCFFLNEWSFIIYTIGE